ncbi:MAG: HEAT repeat domain-containing protein [Verrucomicrobia bacterium]|nr:HEAT repeat domain-containing protein [Verrucomicrobiota bacterium]
MHGSHFLRAALAAVIFPGAALLRAAETADDDEPPVARGRIREAGTRLAAPDIAPASDEAAQALKRMQVPDGLEVKLWAAEPMLANPVAFAFDERGRILVAETYRYRSSVLDIRDYMWMLEDELACRTVEDRAALIKKAFGPAGEKELSIEGEVVRLLADTDGDGVADRSSVYADGFNSPLDGIGSGVLARRGQVWFTNIPSLWRFQGADRAESRAEISRGYGVRFNFTGHDLHGLVFGPDGRIYFSNGDRGATVTTKEGRVLSVPDEGAVFRCYPDGSQMELFATGLRNPQALVFNEVGDLFTGDNDCDHGDEERLVHVVEGGDSGWRVGYQFAPLGKAGPWNLERLWHPRHDGQAAYLLPPICNLEDGPSGIEYYPGTGLNPSYQGHLFVTHFKGSVSSSGIFTYTLKPKGASYEVATAQPFLTNALPTDVKFGPDGRLYTSDWATGWPKSKRGRIYAISDPRRARDPLIAETKALIGGDWTKRSAEELARLLAHADWRVRLEAQFELAERGPASTPVFTRVASDRRAPRTARLHALWGLGQLASRHSVAMVPVAEASADPDAEVRAQAVKLVGEHHQVGYPSPKFLADFARFLQDPSPRVRFFAALSLGKLARPADTPALLAALRENDNRDHYLRHALVMGLVGGNASAALSAAVTDPSPAVRLGVLLALRRLRNPEIARFLNDRDPRLVHEAALAINDAPVESAQPALAALLDRPSADEPVLFRAINAHFRIGQPANAATLAQYAARSDAPPRARAEALARLAEWPRPLQRDRLVGTFRPLPEKTRDRGPAVAALTRVAPALLAPGTPPAVSAAALQALQSLEVAGAADTLLSVLRDAKQPGATRAAALATLDRIKDPRLADAVRFAGESSDSTLRLAALPIASRLSPDTAAPVLASLVARGTTAEKKAAFRTLGFSRHPTADSLIAGQLRELAAGRVPPEVQLELVTAAGRRSDPAIKELLAAREAALAASPDPLAPHRVALAGGNAERGRRIFETQPVLSCIRCHRAGGDGGEAGPNLAEVGTRYSREYLLEAIVKPNAKIAPGYDTIVVTLRNGESAAGIVASETADTLTLRNTDNKLVEVRRTDIAKRESAPSGMPEIYGTILSKAELRDVVEFLASLTDKEPRLDARLPRALRGLPPPPKPAE